MASFPGPVHGDHPEAAEQRLKALHDRFGKVSGSLGHARRRRAAGEWVLSPFEMVMAAGVVVFLIYAAGMAFGLV